MNDSFVPKYKDGKHPTDPTAEIFTLADYLRNASTDEKEKGLHLVNDNSSTLQITTAYDTTSSRRLIVDGCKCSLGIMSKMHDNQTFPTVTILECYGESIPQMFCGDYSNVTQEGLINYYFIPSCSFTLRTVASDSSILSFSTSNVLAFLRSMLVSSIVKSSIAPI